MISIRLRAADVMRRRAHVEDAAAATIAAAAAAASSRGKIIAILGQHHVITSVQWKLLSSPF